MPHTCLVFVFLQNWDSFSLESFNPLVCSLGFVVEIVSLVQSASHLSGVQLEMDYPEDETALLVVTRSAPPRYWDNLFLEGVRLLHVEGKTIDKKAISSGHSLHHLLGEYVQDDLMRHEVALLHHREELGASLAA